jgi:hypothetical protein
MRLTPAQIDTSNCTAFCPNSSWFWQKSPVQPYTTLTEQNVWV